MEALALDFEWQLYSQAGARPEILCPDFLMGDGEKGILRDVDRFVQTFAHGKLTSYEGRSYTGKGNTEIQTITMERFSVPDGEEGWWHPNLTNGIEQHRV